MDVTIVKLGVVDLEFFDKAHLLVHELLEMMGWVLSHILIEVMTPSPVAIRHLPFAHLLTHFFEEVGVDLALGGKPLSGIETVGAAILLAMKNRYVRPARSSICEEDIPAGHYGEYESPHDLNLDVDFDECEYQDLSFLYQQGTDDDEHDA
ncbi:hypothetical protein Sjap_008486 [Stephania japonica]|uniref:Uncharacterized protein n=1 Tax=Stephania japonica TaxID=461633 RepID=A0AAP0JPQ7_9MAGN